MMKSFPTVSKFLILGLTLGLANSSVMASNEPTKKKDQSQAAAQSVAEEEASSKFGLSYWAELYGPSLSSPIEATTPNSSGDANGPINMYNTLTPSYQAGENLSFNLTARFTTFLSREDIPGANGQPATQEQGAGFQLLDPRIGAKITSIAQAGRWSLPYVWAGFQVPLTDGSISAERLISLRSVQINTLNLGGGFTAGTWTIQLFNFYRATNGEVDVAQFYVAPWLKYNVNDQVNTMVTMENTFDISNEGNYFGNETYVRTLVYYAPLQGFEIGPYAKFYPGNLSINSTTLGMEISANIL